MKISKPPRQGRRPRQEGLYAMEFGVPVGNPLEEPVGEDASVHQIIHRVVHRPSECEIDKGPSLRPSSLILAYFSLLFKAALSAAPALNAGTLDASIFSSSRLGIAASGARAIAGLPR